MAKKTANLSMSREALIALLAKFVLAVCGFIGIIIFARVLGVEGLGKYYAILAAANLAAQVPSGAMGAIKKRVSEVGTPTEEYFGLGIIFNGSYLITLFLAVILSYSLIKDYLGPLAFGVALVGVVASLSSFALVNRVYAGTGHPGGSFWTDAVRSVLTLAGQVTMLLLGWHVLGLLLGFIVGTILSAALVYLLIRIRPKIPSKETISRTYKFARWSIPNGLLNNLYSRLDVLVLYVLVSSTAAGLYEPALRLTVPATFMSAAISDTLIVKASGLHSIDKDVVSDLKNAVSYTSLLAIPIFFGALAMPEALMRTVYGPEYTAGAGALVGLAVFQLLNTFSDPFEDVIYGVDRPDLQFRVNGIILLIHVPLAVFLALGYGLLGVIFSTIIAESIRVGSYLVISYSLFDELVIPRQVIKQFISGLVMFVLILLVLTVLPVTSWLRLISVVALGAAVYFTALSVISSHFRITLKNAFAELG